MGVSFRKKGKAFSRRQAGIEQIKKDFKEGNFNYCFDEVNMNLFRVRDVKVLVNATRENGQDKQFAQSEVEGHEFITLDAAIDAANKIWDMVEAIDKPLPDVKQPKAEKTK